MSARAVVVRMHMTADSRARAARGFIRASNNASVTPYHLHVQIHNRKSTLHNRPGEDSLARLRFLTPADATAQHHADGSGHGRSGVCAAVCRACCPDVE